MKKFILNADDFGKSKDYNRAVLNACNSGFVKSASLMANGNAFESAINEIVPECPHMSVGVHLNITEGKSLTECPLLTDEIGFFNKGYLYIMLNSSKPEFRREIEREFRAQIEKIISAVKPAHIDSHCHVHAIPALFSIVCKLAKEYEIPYVRTQHEKFYFVPEIKYVLSYKFAVNILKIILLNIFTNKNKKLIAQNGLRTNDYIIGVGYTGMMDAKTLEQGLKIISDNGEVLVEALIHPCSYLRDVNDSHTEEFKLTQNKILEDSIYRMGFEISNHKV